MELIINHIGGLASLIGSLTVVGGALLWLYNQFIGKPKELRREREEEKRQSRMLEVITRENKPLNHSINQLNKWLEESKKDREQLNKTVNRMKEKQNNHFDMLHNHDDRILVLEVETGVRKKYREDD